MIELYYGKAEEIMPTLPQGCASCVVTDPPYPDYHAERYGYYDGILSLLDLLPCRQLIFWTSKEDFPLSYTAVHIWHKQTGVGSEYERIFERNGQHNFKVFSYRAIHSALVARWAGDIFTGHPSQKPIRLMSQLIELFTVRGDVILDPFMGSGSTGVACAKAERGFIGIERDPEYFAIAKRRIAEAQMQPQLELSA